MLSTSAVALVPAYKRRQSYGYHTGMDQMWSYGPYMTEHLELSSGAHHTGLVGPGDLGQFDTQVEAGYQAFAVSVAQYAPQAGCALSPDDTTLWQGDLDAWEKQHQENLTLLASTVGWAGVLTDLNPGTYLILNNYAMATQSFASKLQSWRQKFAAQCPAYKAPAAISGNAPGGSTSQSISWFCSTFGLGCPSSGDASQSDWSGTIKYIAVAAIVVAVLVYVAPVLSTFIVAHNVAKGAAAL